MVTGSVDVSVSGLKDTVVVDRVCPGSGEDAVGGPTGELNGIRGMPLQFSAVLGREAVTCSGNIITTVRGLLHQGSGQVELGVGLCDAHLHARLFCL